MNPTQTPTLEPEPYLVEGALVAAGVAAGPGVGVRAAAGVAAGAAAVAALLAWLAGRSEAASGADRRDEESGVAARVVLQGLRKFWE